MKKKLIAPAVALSLGLSSALGTVVLASPATAAPAEEGTYTYSTPKSVLTVNEVKYPKTISVTFKGKFEVGKPYKARISAVHPVSKQFYGVVEAEKVATNANEMTFSLQHATAGKYGPPPTGQYYVDLMTGDGKYLIQPNYTSKIFKVVKSASKPAPKAPKTKASMSVLPKKVALKDFLNPKKGVNIAVKGLKPGTKVTFNIKPKNKRVQGYVTTLAADKKGNIHWVLFGKNKTNTKVYLGTVNVVATVNDGSGKTFKSSFTVVKSKKSAPKDAPKKDAPKKEAPKPTQSKNELPRTGQGLEGLAAGALLLAVGGATVLVTRRTRKG